jgi:hypothetical protein
MFPVRQRGAGHDGLTWFEDALKLKHLILLLCLVLFVAAVDATPDPPAINPPVGHSCTISAFHDYGSLTIFEKQWRVTFTSLRYTPVNWPATRTGVDEKPVGMCAVPLIEHATDSSPPILS